MKLLVGFYNKSVIVTYIGVASAITGIFFAVTGSIKAAMLCMILCGLCDMLDGTFARRCKRTDEEKEFGLQIDSLADMMSFAAFPVAIGIGLGCTRWYNIVISVFYVLAAITRLGFFNITSMMKTEKRGCYRGLPVTFASLIFTLVWLVGNLLKAAHFKLIFSIVMLITSIFFVLNIKIQKPNGTGLILFGIIAFGMIAAVIFIGV